MIDRFPDGHPRPPRTEASPEFTRLFVIAMLTAVFLGVFSSAIWIAWNLFRLHVLR